MSRSLQGQWNFADVVNHIKARMRLIPAWHAQLVVEDGDIAYHDAHGFGVGSLPIQQEIADVSGSMLRQGVDGYAFDVAAADAGHFGHVRVKGLYSISARDDTHVDVDADSVAMNEVEHWLPKNLPITFTNGSAALRLSALIHSLPAPGQAHKLSRTELTADVDLSGVGLRLREMSAPMVATSGRLAWCSTARAIRTAAGWNSMMCRHARLRCRSPLMVRSTISTRSILRIPTAVRDLLAIVAQRRFHLTPRVPRRAPVAPTRVRRWINVECHRAGCAWPVAGRR